MPELPDNETPSVTVAEFLAGSPKKLGIEMLAGEDGLRARCITAPRIQKLGLALAGFQHYIHHGRLQIVGQSEIWYLGQLNPEQRAVAIRNLGLEKISCVLVTKGLEPPAELLDAATGAHLPVFRTHLISSAAINLVTDYLDELLAPRTTRHGVLLDLYGLGVLLEGDSGIGKSECALDLITRGHRLVSDDSIEVRRVGPDRLQGRAPELLREHLEIRGLGILNIKDLFGVSSLSAAKDVDLAIRLVRWDDSSEVDRLGIDSHSTRILGVSVPQVVLPVSPGRNLTTLVETAVRIHLLRMRGYDAAQEFVARHTALLNGGA